MTIGGLILPPFPEQDECGFLQILQKAQQLMANTSHTRTSKTKGVGHESNASQAQVCGCDWLWRNSIVGKQSCTRHRQTHTHTHTHTDTESGRDAAGMERITFASPRWYSKMSLPSAVPWRKKRRRAYISSPLGRLLLLTTRVVGFACALAAAVVHGREQACQLRM